MPWLLKMTLLAATIKAAIDLYLGWRIIRAVDYLNPAPGSNLGWIAILFLLAFYLLPLNGLFQYLLGANTDILTYPQWMFYLFWGGFAFSFQVLTWMVGMDLLKIIANANGINAPFLDQIWGGLVLAVSVIVLVFTGVKMYNDTTSIETDSLTHAVERLPVELNDFKIAHITDIQADRYTGTPQVAEYVERTNAQEPDMIVITGDLISYGTDYVEMAARELAKLEAPYGVYFVVGDHDYWAGTENITSALREQGIRILEGENDVIKIGDATIKLSGLTNVYSRKAPAEEIQQVTKDSTDVGLRMMITHQVSDAIVEHCLSQQYHMLLAGHTHGGQLRVPLFFTKFSAPDFETQYVNNAYYKNGMLVNINSGLGFTLAPVRYNAPASISVITLEQK